MHGMGSTHPPTGVVLPLFAVIAALLVGCGSGNDDAGRTSTDASGAGKSSETKSVTIRDYTYEPATITVAQGTTVTFTNQGLDAPHRHLETIGSVRKRLDRHGQERRGHARKGRHLRLLLRLPSLHEGDDRGRMSWRPSAQAGEPARERAPARGRCARRPRRIRSGRDAGEGEAEAVLAALDHEVGAGDEGDALALGLGQQRRRVGALGEVEPEEVAAAGDDELGLGDLLAQRLDQRVAARLAARP